MATYIYEQKNIEFKYPFDNVPYINIWWKNENGDILESMVEPIITKSGFVLPSFSNTTDDINEVYSKFEWIAVANTSTNRLTINTTPEDAEINVEFYNPEVVFTINPTPSDAVVTLTADGYTQEGNSIIVEPGTSVNYSVEGKPEVLYAWDYEGDNGEPQTIYTKSPLPIVGSYPCDENGNDYCGYGDIGTSSVVILDPTIDVSTETMITITSSTEK